MRISERITLRRVNGHGTPVLFDIIIEEPDILLKFCVYQEGSVLGEVRTLLLLVIDGVSRVAQYDHTRLHDELTRIGIRQSTVAIVNGREITTINHAL